MPLCKLEYTGNIQLPAPELTSFFKTLHLSMVDIIQTELASCKSCAVPLPQYCIGDGSNNGGFVLLYIQILPGRDDAQKRQLQESSSDQLKALLKQIGYHEPVQLRVILSEGDKKNYYMDSYS